MRVLQIVTDTDRRGAQVFGVDLHRALEAFVDGVDTVALTAGRVGGLDLETLGPTAKSPRTGLALRRRARSFDVVVAHGSTTLPMCALWLAGTGVPFVYRQISDPLAWAPDRLRRARVRAGYRRAAHVVALWEGSAEVLVEHFGVPRSRITVIPNGVAAERMFRVTPARRRRARARFGLPQDARVAVFVGALAYEKGADIAIDAVAEIDGVRLLVVGDGPARPDLEERAAAQAPGRVAFTGAIRDPGAAYAAADVVVVPSRSESMPAVVIEAGLSGVPCVATAVGAVPTMLAHDNGVLVPPEAPSALAAALRDVLCDSQRAARLAESAYGHAGERWALESVAGVWADLLRAVALGGDRSSTQEASP